jgi:prophage DNA circulation protein
MTKPPWKLELQPAIYNRVVFHVEVQARASGQRVALHEFPKRNTPYAEQMGRRARKFNITAYLIGPNFKIARDAMIVELEKEGPGQLQLPTQLNGEVKAVVVDQYSATERRDQGGYVTFEIAFIEAGTDTSTIIEQDTPGAVNDMVNNAVADPTLVQTPGADLSGTTGLGGGASTVGPTTVSSANTFMASSDFGAAGVFPSSPGGIGSL